MRLILGLDSPTAGTVTIDGKPHPQLPSPMREVGALLDARAVHGGRGARRLPGQAIRVRTPQPDALARAVAAAGGTGRRRRRSGRARGARSHRGADRRHRLRSRRAAASPGPVPGHAGAGLHGTDRGRRWSTTLGLPAGALAVLTLREREVLSLVAQGRSNTAIASAFTISPQGGGKTRRQHLRQARPRPLPGTTTAGSWPRSEIPGILTGAPPPSHPRCGRLPARPRRATRSASRQAQRAAVRYAHESAGLSGDRRRRSVRNVTSASPDPPAGRAVRLRPPGRRPWRCRGLANRLVRGLLRTPLLCRIVGGRLVTLYVVGRKNRSPLCHSGRVHPPGRDAADRHAVRLG